MLGRPGMISRRERGVDTDSCQRVADSQKSRCEGGKCDDDTGAHGSPYSRRCCDWVCNQAHTGSTSPRTLGVGRDLTLRRIQPHFLAAILHTPPKHGLEDSRPARSVTILQTLFCAALKFLIGLQQLQ